MKRLVIALATLPFALAMTAAPALANPPVAFEPGGTEGAHPHHVVTGNGGCVDINRVFFEATADSGLHHGILTSAANPRGITHGSC